MKTTAIFTLVIAAMATMLQAQDAKPTVLDAANLDELRNHIGEDVVVEGNVTEVGKTKSNSITFINIGLPKKQGFVALIFQKNYGAFPDGFEGYKRQKLRVTGNLTIYQGDTPQIEVRSPEQIQIVDNE